LEEMMRRQVHGDMTKRTTGVGDVPTLVGDVLILKTKRSFDTYAVGRIQFGSGSAPTYATDYLAAVSLAKSLATSGRRIFLENFDTGEWREISD
jgi:hypothetical protein